MKRPRKLGKHAQIVSSNDAAQQQNEGSIHVKDVTVCGYQILAETIGDQVGPGY